MCRKLCLLQWIIILDFDNPLKEPHLVVLGHIWFICILQVMRVLPEWLSHPTIVEHDLTHNQIAVDEYTLISTKIAAALKQNDITHLFPGKLTHSVCYSSNF